MKSISVKYCVLLKPMEIAGTVLWQWLEHGIRNKSGIDEVRTLTFFEAWDVSNLKNTGKLPPYFLNFHGRIFGYYYFQITITLREKNKEIRHVNESCPDFAGQRFCTQITHCQEFYEESAVTLIYSVRTLRTPCY